MVLRIGKLASTVGKLGKMIATKGKQVKNYSLFPMKRENAGCLIFAGILAAPTIGSIMLSRCTGAKNTAPAPEPEEFDENITAQAQAADQNMDEIIEKYGFSSLDPLGKLTSVEHLDTLKFFSVEDSLAYDRINRYANGLYKKARQDEQIAYNEADSIADRNYFVADSIASAKWAEYSKKEREALNQGDLEAVKKYRDLKMEALRTGENAKLKAVRDGEAAKSQVCRDGEQAKLQAARQGEEFKNEARRTLGVFVRPYQIKAE